MYNIQILLTNLSLFEVNVCDFINFRSITKILGEWWANLDKEEKACYTGLAKQVIFEFLENASCVRF